MRLLKQSTARDIVVFMTDSTDHVTGKTGLTLTITASKNAGAFASISPTVTELATGWYKVALTSSHTDTLGDLALHITATGADPTDTLMQVVALLPGEAVTLQADQAVNVTKWAGAATATDDIALKSSLAKGTDITGFTDLDAAGVRTAVGLGSANLDTQIGTLATAANLSTVAGYIDTEVASILATVDTEVAAIKAKTDNLPASPAATGDAMTLTAAERNAVADALLARNVAGGSSAGRTVKEALYVLRNKTAIAGGTLTVYETDDSTAAFTAAVTTSAGDPISAIDPS